MACCLATCTTPSPTPTASPSRLAFSRCSSAPILQRCRVPVHTATRIAPLKPVLHVSIPYNSHQGHLPAASPAGQQSRTASVLAQADAEDAKSYSVSFTLASHLKARSARRAGGHGANAVAGRPRGHLLVRVWWVQCALPGGGRCATGRAAAARAAGAAGAGGG